MGLFPTDDADYAATYAQEAAMVDASELIAEALESSGLTQADLARSLGVGRSEVTARLRGDRNITVRNLALTLHVLGSKLELGSVTEPTPATQRHNVEPDAYLKWVAPKSYRHHDGMAAPSGFEMAGRK